MSNQFLKAGFVQIGDAKFWLHSPVGSYFSSVPGDNPLESTVLDFSVKVSLDKGGVTVGVVKLYNPTDKTIDACRPKKGGKNIKFIPIKVEAGYIDNTFEVFNNFISSFSIYKDGVTEILEIITTDKIDSKGNVWWDKKVPGSYNGKKVSEILTEIVAPKKILYGKTGVLTPDPVKKTYNTSGSIVDEVTKLAKFARFSWALASGVIYIVSKGDVNGEPIQTLDAENGLIGFPERLDKQESKNKTGKVTQWEGYLLKTISTRNFQLQQPIKFVDGFKQELTGEIRGFEKFFSTFEDSFSSYKVEI